MPRRQRVGRYSRAALWCAVLVFGFVAGAAVVMLADPGSSAATAPVDAHTQHATQTASLVHDHAAHSSTETAFLFPDGDDRGWSRVDSNGDQHGHFGRETATSALPASERDLLVHQLGVTMQAAALYPTVKDAEAAGYRRAGSFVPGLGAHYVSSHVDFDGNFTDDDLLHPGGIVYADTSPDSAIVGFMYESIASPEVLATKGFAGANDHWHTHSGVCLKSAGGGANDELGADGSITEAQCTERGGRSSGQINVSLLHVWTAPGYADPLGVFAHNNPAVTCPDGSFYTHRVGTQLQCGVA